MATLFKFLLIFLAFLWVVSKCGNDNGSDYESSPSVTDSGTEEVDMSPEATKARILEAEEAQKAEENRIKEEAAADKRFLKSKSGKIYKKHPEWSREDCERLANNKIWIGMGYDMLKYKRGLPNSANPSNYGNGTQWQWCWDDYTPSCFYDNDGDGNIDSYN